jgi:hypothetical protein
MRYSTVEAIDKKVFLTFYYAYLKKDDIKKNSRLYNELDELLDNYHRFVHNIKGSRNTLERNLDEMYETISPYPKNVFEPLREGIKVQLRGGGLGDSNDGKSSSVPINKQREMLLNRITNDVVNKVDTEGKQYAEQRMIGIMESVAESMEHLTHTIRRDHNVELDHLKDQIALKELKIKQLEETLSLQTNKLSASHWITGAMSLCFKNMLFAIPYAIVKLSWTIVSKAIYIPLVYPLEVVVKFYGKKVALVVGHIHVIIILGTVYYILLHAYEDERMDKMCEEDPETFMCSQSQRKFVRDSLSYVIPAGSTLANLHKKIYSATLHVAADGAAYLAADIVASISNFIASLIPSSVAGAYKIFNWVT